MAMTVPAAVPTLMQIGFVSLPHSLILFDRVVLRLQHICMILCAFSLMWKKPYLKSMYSSMYRRMKVKNWVLLLVCARNVRLLLSCTLLWSMLLWSMLLCASLPEREIVFAAVCEPA